MKKSYSQFTHEDLEALGCKTIRDALFSNIPNITPTDWLITTLAINHKIPSDSEKAKSELFISSSRLINFKIKKNIKKLKTNKNLVQF